VFGARRESWCKIKKSRGGTKGRKRREGGQETTTRQTEDVQKRERGKLRDLAVPETLKEPEKKSCWEPMSHAAQKNVHGGVV